MNSRRVAAALIAWSLALGLVHVPHARANENVFVHVVREGETLASIAQRYYGDPRREGVLVTENGLNTQGGSEIVVGLRLDVPTVAYHRVQAGETWAQLAERFYGDARRAFALVEANEGSTGAQPDPGAELLVPYPLRHVAGQHDSVNDIAELYFGTRDAARTLRRFNNIRGNRLTRGQIVLVPLPDLVLSEEGRRLIAEQTGEQPGGGEVREQQHRIDDELEVLREHNRRGRFTEAVALGNRLLGIGDLTGNQVVTVQRELGTSYVALDREDLAVDAYRIALGHQPDLELDLVRTSPRVLQAFRHARETPASADVDGGVPDDAAVAVDGGAPDAGR